MHTGMAQAGDIPSVPVPCWAERGAERTGRIPNYACKVLGAPRGIRGGCKHTESRIAGSSRKPLESSVLNFGPILRFLKAVFAPFQPMGVPADPEPRAGDTAAAQPPEPTGQLLAPSSSPATWALFHQTHSGK